MRPVLLEDAMDDTIKKTPAQHAPGESAAARSRTARAIVVDVLAGALWRLLVAETTTETHVPSAARSRPRCSVPSVSQPVEISGS